MASGKIRRRAAPQEHRVEARALEQVMRQSSGYRNGLALAGLIAALALVVKAFQDLRSGWPLLLVAVVLLAALVLRRFVFRD